MEERAAESKNDRSPQFRDKRLNCSQPEKWGKGSQSVIIKEVIVAASSIVLSLLFLRGVAAEYRHYRKR